MCGISAAFGSGWRPAQLRGMIAAQEHRGPDDQGIFIDAQNGIGLGHNRLSIIDLSSAGHQPLANQDGSLHLVMNGEIYNYLELREELRGYPFQSQSDSEVILAAYERWGLECADRFVGMFAFILWDGRKRRLFACRDRFGVKPLYYSRQPEGNLFFASEIKALHAAGVPRTPDAATWASYLAHGLYEHSSATFWLGISSLPPGHWMICDATGMRISCWYDMAARCGTEFDTRPEEVVAEEYRALLIESVRLRFRSDVPVGINVSGGLDSSTLLGAVRAVQLHDSARAFTFITGDQRYDELPWVQQSLEHTKHPSTRCLLRVEEVPEVAGSVQRFEDEPFGGLPTLAYARLFEKAREAGTVVLLDGQGMDEQWAGYDYYAAPEDKPASLVQGVSSAPVRPGCMTPEFRQCAAPWRAPTPFPDRLRNLQYRDLRFTKIPRALRFNDRVSMRVSTELREPFLDHRLFELALRQPAERKILDGVRKRMLRGITASFLPSGVVEAPKRPLQTPQREWLRGPLRPWAHEQIHAALEHYGNSWLEPRAVKAAWDEFLNGPSDNSFYVWQWISLGMQVQQRGAAAAAAGSDWIN